MNVFEQADAQLAKIMPDLAKQCHTIWSGRPSQWINIKHYLLCLIFIAFFITTTAPYLGAVVALYMIYRYLVVRCTRYDLYEDRFTLTNGILDQEVDNIQLYRVKDVHIYRPILWRIVGLGGVAVVTSDKTTALLAIECIRDVDFVFNQMREMTEKQRDSKGVKEFDLR